MGLAEIGEFGFIHRITRGCLIRPAGVLKGIGDDAAAFLVGNDRVALLTTDLLVERVHFIRGKTGGFDLGYKALAVNLSDIAAMGGTAREAFVSLAVPDDVALDYLDAFYDGMRSLACEFEVNILGGDTTGSKADLIINIAVAGEVPEKEILYRDTAREGDIVFVTGPLGDSRAGLHLLLHDLPHEAGALQALVEAHRRPRPHLREGRFLARQPGVHAAIDVSDGFSSDLGHIAEASGLGARIEAARLPISGPLHGFCRRFNFEPAAFAVAGGEDYVLICTVDPSLADAVSDSYRRTFPSPLHRLGEMTAGGPLELTDSGGRTRPMAATGWDHFQRYHDHDIPEP